MNFIKIRKYPYIFSGLLIIATIFGMIYFGFNLGIDFKGGSLLEINLNKEDISSSEVEEIMNSFDLGDSIISKTERGSFIIRTKDVSEETHQEILNIFKNKFEGAEEERFESIGPAIGQELRQKSITAMILVVVGIALYLAWAFRKVSRPMSSWKYGIVTIIALIHDVLIPAGVFVYLGYFSGMEIDSSFIVAILVVLGFSVHDTIVVLDRIREKLSTEPKLEFGEIINKSIKETLVRSFNTSITLIFVLVALLIFGPASLWGFTLVLLIGTLAGTYSSIFLASPLLYDWYLRSKAGR